MNLFNGRGEYVGRIEQDGDSAQTAYDASGRQIGFQNDQGTFESDSDKIGSPGLLGSLFSR